MKIIGSFSSKKFWTKVNKYSGVFATVKGKRSECWMWIGALAAGYGVFSLGSREAGSLGAHVLSYIISRRLKKKPKLQILHHCDNRPCVRPNHLWKGTQLDNMRDKVQKGRQSKGENHNKSKLTEKEVIFILHRYFDGRNTQTELAAKHNVKYQAIHDIVINKTWRHLKRER